jgi:signal transduction histidine kinase
MQQRAGKLKGDIVIKSEPGVGTEIRINCRLR